MMAFWALLVAEGIWTTDTPQLTATLINLISTGFSVFCLTDSRFRKLKFRRKKKTEHKN